MYNKPKPIPWVYPWTGFPVRIMSKNEAESATRLIIFTREVFDRNFTYQDLMWIDEEKYGRVLYSY